ncbi:V-type ATP synthase subunit F, partial [Dysosmobacter welbionis]
HQHHTGADGGAQVGLHALNAGFAQDRGETGKHRRAEGVEHPAPALGCTAGRGGPFLQHQEGACADQHYPDPLRQADGLPQQKKGQQDGEHGAGFVDGHHLVDVTQLE